MLKSINSFAKLASDRSEVVGASLVLLMITMMVIPMSPFLLDILIALNICATVVLVLSAVLLDTPLSFSSFPAILLMTTLFRLSLTISTTRQILLEANAGEIIQTFGEFVVGGNVAVGLVIFLIISVVNFLVVTKGSERVAEVAARFSLDSMPGKQMSIDGDARAGNLTQDQAKQKRSELEKESQLFGAMDGAIKFVKNDAIAGLVITVINLVGGLTVGMVQHEMDFSTAGNVYTILSVGDGLVAIIPSLMTSVAAGLIVTRVTKGQSDGSNTAQDMIRELTANPKALQISGFFCLLFSFVPGMPTPVFLIAGGFLLFRSFSVKKPTAEDAGLAPEDPSDSFARMLEGLEEKKGARVPEDKMESNTFAPLEVRFSPEMEPTQQSLLFSIVKFVRNQLIEETGIVYPIFLFRQDEKLIQPQIFVFGVPMLKFPVFDRRMQVTSENPEQMEAIKDLVALEFDPNLGRYSYFAQPTDKKLLDEKEGISYRGFERRWAVMVELLLVSKSKDFFSLNDVQQHLNRMNDTHGELVKELARILPVAKVTEVFQNLLNERVSIRNANQVFASLIDWGQRERDSMIITEQVRRGLSEQISHQYALDNVLYVLSVDSELEQFVRENLRNDGQVSFVDVDSATLARVVEMISAQLKSFAFMEQLPIVVCSMDIRPYFKQFIQERLKSVHVMSYQEVSSSRELQLLGTIVFDESLIEEHDNESQDTVG